MGAGMARRLLDFVSITDDVNCVLAKEFSDVEVTPLMMAVRKVKYEGDTYCDIIQTLLRHPEIDVNKYVKHRTAIHWAASFDVKSEIGVKLLLQQSNCDVNAVQTVRGEYKSTALMLAVVNIEKHGDHFWKIAQMLLHDPRTDVNMSLEGSTVLHRAISRNAMSHFGVELLLSQESCDINAICTTDFAPKTALMKVIQCIRSADDHFVKMLRIILAHPKLDINLRVNKRTAIHVAVSDCQSSLGLKILLENPHCDINALYEGDKPYKTALMMAVTPAKPFPAKVKRDELHAKHVGILLTHDKLDVNRSVEGFTALHWATLGSNFIHDAAKLLVENPFTDVNAVCTGAKPTKTLLMHLVREVTQLNSRILSLLLKRKDLDVNQCVNGLRAIHWACDSLSVDGLKMLLSREDCDSNALATGPDGSTYSSLMYLLRLLATDTCRSAPASTEMLDILLKQESLKINMHVQEIYALHVAHRSDFVVPLEVTQKLLDLPTLDINVPDPTTDPPLTLIEKAVSYARSSKDEWSKMLALILKRKDLMIPGDILHQVLKRGLLSGDHLEALFLDERVDVNAVDYTLDQPLTVLMHVITRAAKMFDDENRAVCSQLTSTLIRNTRLDINKIISSACGFQWAISIGAFPSCSEILLDHENIDMSAPAVKFMDAVSEVKEAQSNYVKTQPIRELLSTPNININKTILGVGAIHNAITEDNWLRQSVVTEYLITLGFDLNIQDKDGNTGLHMIVEMKNETLAKLLLDTVRIDVNIQNQKGNTPLMDVFNVFPNYSPDYFRWIAMFLRHPRINIGLKTKHEQLTVGDLLVLRDNQERPQFNRSRLAELIEEFKKENIEFQWGEHILATAIRYNSTRLCEVLLKTGATCDSYLEAIRFTNTGQVLDRELAINCAIMEDSHRKVELLKNRATDLTIKWRGLTLLQLAVACNASPKIIFTLLSEDQSAKEKLAEAAQHFGVVGETLDEFCQRRKFHVNLKHLQGAGRHYVKPDVKLGEDRQKGKSTEAIKWLKRCREEFKEHTGLKTSVEVSTNVLMEEIKEGFFNQFGEQINFILCGSMSEGTKVYLPNEFDYLCVLEKYKLRKTWLQLLTKFQSSLGERLSPVDRGSDQKVAIDKVSGLAGAFYDMLEEVLLNLDDHKMAQNKVLLFQKPLIRGNKVSRIQLLWENEGKRMPIHIDVIPAFTVNHIVTYPVYCENFYTIAKVSRHAQYKRTLDNFTLSYSEVEKEFLRAVPLVVKHGYILAKAVRITCIAKPDEDLRETFALDEDIEIDELVSSHMLKTCLIREFAERKEDDITAVDVAIKVYEHFHSELKSGVLTSWCNDEIKLYDCSACLNARAKFPTTDQPLQV